MDLVYIPEVLTYGSFRSPQYRDYEQPWNKDYFRNCKKPISTNRWPSIQQPVEYMSKKNCYLCKEKKRRKLADYIKNKSRSDFCNGIHEEDEEDEKEEDDTISSEKKVEDGKNKSTKSSRDTKDEQKS